MVGLRLYTKHETDHLNIRPVPKKTRWHLFVWYSNGWTVRYSNGIPKTDHLASKLFSTIQKPDQLGIQIPTLQHFCLGSEQSNVLLFRAPLEFSTSGANFTSIKLSYFFSTSNLMFVYHLLTYMKSKKINSSKLLHDLQRGRYQTETR